MRKPKGDSLVADRMQARQMSWAALPTLQTQPDTTTDIDLTLLRRLCPPYKVLLHNDDHNDMAHVVQALVRTIPHLSLDQAVRIMLTAHFHGIAVVIICPRETAEFYRERLEYFGLTVTIESDD
jgi:ATP-dependent Clp protease adaptor protein ClpS